MDKTIMVVDDEPDVRDSAKLVLEKNGYNVITAENGDDCLQKLSELGDKKPDLILLDVMMPGKPVSEVSESIEGIKIALFTVVRMSEAEQQKLLTSNIVAYIQKPFELNELLTKVKELTN